MANYKKVLVQFQLAHKGLIKLADEVRSTFKYVLDIHAKYETHLMELEALLKKQISNPDAEKADKIKTKANVCLTLLNEIENAIKNIIVLSRDEEKAVLIEEAGALSGLKGEGSEESFGINNSLRALYSDLRKIIATAKKEINKGLEPEKAELLQITGKKQMGLMLLSEDLLNSLTTIFGRKKRTEATRLQHTINLLRYASIELVALKKKENKELEKFKLEIDNLERIENSLKTTGKRIESEAARMNM